MTSIGLLLAFVIGILIIGNVICVVMWGLAWLLSRSQPPYTCGSARRPKKETP